MKGDRELAQLLDGIWGHDTIEDRGTDVFIMLYDGSSEWTYWSGDKSIRGRHCNSYDSMGYALQLREIKSYLVCKVGEKIKDARLHVSNHRDDRDVW
jgi:hypothetical protein